MLGSCCLHHRKHLGDDGGITQFEGVGFHDCAPVAPGEASLRRILTEPKNALVKQYQRLFQMEGVDLTLAEDALGAIVRKAIDRRTGAQGLRSIMEALLLDTMFDLPPRRRRGSGDL
jgi:hypothetical protein